MNTDKHGFMSKYFNKEHGPTYYMILGIISALIPLPLFFTGYLCVKAGEYWPLIIFGVSTFFAWGSAYNMFRTARAIKQSKNRPEDEV